MIVSRWQVCRSTAANSRDNRVMRSQWCVFVAQLLHCPNLVAAARTPLLGCITTLPRQCMNSHRCCTSACGLPSGAAPGAAVGLAHLQHVLVAIAATVCCRPQELISAKVALAQCAEREVIWRREMFKARQTNKQLAQKMGRLESLVSVIVDKDAA